MVDLVGVLELLSEEEEDSVVDSVGVLELLVEA